MPSIADIEAIIAEALNTSVAEIRQAMTATGTGSSGRTARSLEVRRGEQSADSVSVAIWGRPYTWAVETGTRPARRRGTDAERQQFIRELYEWCKRRGLPDGAATEADRMRFAKFLKWHINKYGSALYRSGGRRDIITPSFERLERELPPKIGGYYQSQVLAALGEEKGLNGAEFNEWRNKRWEFLKQ